MINSWQQWKDESQRCTKITPTAIHNKGAYGEKQR